MDKKSLRACEEEVGYQSEKVGVKKIIVGPYQSGKTEVVLTDGKVLKNLTYVTVYDGVNKAKRFLLEGYFNE